MNVSTIQMEPELAQAKLEAYREVLERRHNKDLDEEFSSVKAACQELAKGTPLISLTDTIKNCGWRPDGRPVLAFGRADQKFVTWHCTRDSRRWSGEKGYYGPYAPTTWEFTAMRKPGATVYTQNLKLTITNVPGEPPEPPKAGTAMLPMVPADVYPSSRGFNLSKHFVLWEVESWNYAPPVDPMLLRHLGGDLYAVVAQWDLTEIERAILSGTRRP
jgi:hypothetical protein